MKIKTILPVVLTIVGATTAITSTQAIATGLTYDPYGIYYSTYYGIDASSVATQSSSEDEVQSFYDPYANYYNTYYGIDGLVPQTKKPAKLTKAPTTTMVNEVDMDGMADPSNFYEW